MSMKQFRRARFLASIIAVGFSCVVPVSYADNACPSVFAASTTATGWFEQGMADFAAGRYDAAVQDYTEAIRLDPSLAFAYVNRGGAYDLLGQRDAAIQDYTEAIRLAPSHPTAYSNRAGLYMAAARSWCAVAISRKVPIRAVSVSQRNWRVKCWSS